MRWEAGDIANFSPFSAYFRDISGGKNAQKCHFLYFASKTLYTAFYVLCDKSHGAAACRPNAPRFLGRFFRDVSKNPYCPLPMTQKQIKRAFPWCMSPDSVILSLPVLPFMLAGGGRLLGWPFSLALIILSSGKRGGRLCGSPVCRPLLITLLPSPRPSPVAMVETEAGRHVSFICLSLFVLALRIKAYKRNVRGAAVAVSPRRGLTCPAYLL